MLKIPNYSINLVKQYPIIIVFKYYLRRRIFFQLCKYFISRIIFQIMMSISFTDLISICFTNRSFSICPRIPNMRIQIIYIITLLLPNPKKFISSCFNTSRTHSNSRKFLLKIITIYNSKFLNSICRFISICPSCSYTFTSSINTIIDNIKTSVFKNSICLRHSINPPNI